MPKYTINAFGEKVAAFETNEPISKSVSRRLQGGTPSTKVDSGGTKQGYSFQGQEIDRSELREIKEIRESGGVISHLVHAKALMQFGTGAEFEAEEDEIAEYCEDQFDNLDNLLIEIGEDAIWYPYSIGEVVETRGGGFSHVELVEPWTMLPVENQYGEVVQWEQEIQAERGGEAEIFDPDEIASFILNKSSGRDKTGISEVKRAEQEITSYRKHSNAIDEVVDSAAWRRHLWKVGRDNGAVVDDNELRRFRNRVDNLEGDTQLVMGKDIEHELMDAMNPESFATITEHDLRKLSLALGLPLELANVGSDGLGSGMPAELRLTLFERQARAAQRSLTNQFVEQVVRPVLDKYSPYPRDADISLNLGDPVQANDQKQNMINSIGDDMTVNERRAVFDKAPLDDDEEGEQFESPGASEQDDGLDNIFNGQGDTGNRSLSGSELEAFEAEIDQLWSEVLWSDDTSKNLTAYSDSQLPEMVKTRMRDAILGGSVFSDIESIPSNELMDLRTTLADSLSDDAWSLDELSETLQDRFDLSEGRAETIARTETQAAVQQAEESAYEDLEEERDEEFVYKWVGPDDSRETEACEWLKEQTNPNYGGDPVGLEELKALVQEAPEHDPEITTEPREWTPHISCRHRYTRVVE